MPARASTGEPGGLWHAETATPPRALRLQATTANALAGRRPYAQPRSPSACPARRSPEDQGETVTVVADTLAAVAGDARLLGEDLASAQTADLEEALCGRLAQELSGCAPQLRAMLWPAGHSRSRWRPGRGHAPLRPHGAGLRCARPRPATRASQAEMNGERHLADLNLHAGPHDGDFSPRR